MVKSYVLRVIKDHISLVFIYIYIYSFYDTDILVSTIFLFFYFFLTGYDFCAVVKTTHLRLKG
jgi:hypothetical protein